MAGVKGRSGRKPSSPLGRKRQFEIHLKPEEAAFLAERYGSVQQAIRAWVASLDVPVPRSMAPQSATLCPHCSRSGVLSCPECGREDR